MVQNPNFATIFDPDGIFQIDLLSPLKNFLNWLASQLFTVVKTVITVINEKIITPIVEGLKWLWDKTTSALIEFVNKIIEAIKSLFVPVEPDRVMANFPKLLIIATGISLSAAGLLAVVGTKVAGTGIEVEPIAKAINRLFNVNVLVGFGLGAITTAVLRVPMGYWAKKTFRPYKPDPSTLFGLYTRGYITRDQLKTELAYVTGYPERYIEGLIDIFEYNPTLFDLIRLSDLIEIPDTVLNYSLKVLGIKEPYFSLLYTMLKKRPLREEMRLNTTLLIKAYSKGYISKETLSRALDGLGILTAEKELLLTYAENLRTYEMIDEQIYILRTAFQKGLIDEATLVRELENLKIAKEWINLIVRRGKLFRKIEIPVPRVMRAYAVELRIQTQYSYSLS